MTSLVADNQIRTIMTTSRQAAHTPLPQTRRSPALQALVQQKLRLPAGVSPEQAIARIEALPGYVFSYAACECGDEIDTVVGFFEHQPEASLQPGQKVVFVPARKKAARPRSAAATLREGGISVHA